MLKRTSFRATVPGSSTSLLQIYPIQIVEFPSRITIIRDPPAAVYVGQSVRYSSLYASIMRNHSLCFLLQFYVSVTATISSGSPLAGTS